MRPFTLLLLLSACTEGTEPAELCEPSERFDAFTDADGDGFGTGDPVEVCALEDGLVNNRIDCNDADPTVFPDAPEICNEMDDNCDGRIDEDLDSVTYYLDDDGDGFGGQFPATASCGDPPEGYVAPGGDCDDGNPAISPGATEVCNDGVDDDCDGVADDADDSTDPDSKTTYYLDNDNDGLGAFQRPLALCEPQSKFVENFRDCDDRTPEITCETGFFEDADLDGYGAAYTNVCSCEGLPGAVTNADDCDDTDPVINIPRPWYTDADLDGWGTGEPVGPEGCFPPGGLDVAPDLGDCNDADPSIFPAAEEICGDGIDQTCSGVDLSCTPETCEHIHEAAPLLPSGTYELFPEGSGSDFYCDMETDNGGWTLVAASALATLNDQAQGYYSDLADLSPGVNAGVYDGFRALIGDNSDVRFTCRINRFASDFTVDLSFYDVDIYDRITAGPDADTCFFPGGDSGFTPRRRNNLTEVVLDQGNAYGFGVMEGEDFCGDRFDFTIDFDNRGMDADQGDGTDWGEDDGAEKCGTSGFNTPNGAWFIFVR